MSRMADEYINIEYQANMQMKEEYNEALDEIKHLEREFEKIASEINKEYDLFIDISNFNSMQKIEDGRYDSLIYIYTKLQEMKGNRDDMKKELKHSGLL